jgi:hypothetical protein
MLTKTTRCGLLGILALVAAGAAVAEAPDGDRRLRLGMTDFYVTAPEGWKRVEKPRFRITEFEFVVPAAEGDEADARVAMMSSQGTVEENISRWKAQFPKVEGEVEEPAEQTIAGQKVYVLDIVGTYEAPPFQGGGTFENYRQLGAILELKGLRNGRYFIKLIGPRRTVDANEEAFTALLESLEAR